MKRALAVLLATVIVVLGTRAIVRSLASDETKIRWTLEALVEGYNEGDVGDTVRPIAGDWRHEGYGFDRDDVRGKLIAEFFQDRDPKTKQLTRRVALDDDTIEIEVAGELATLTFDAGFERVKDDLWTEVWRARIEADLERGDSGWLIHRTRHTDLLNTPLSR